MNVLADQIRKRRERKGLSQRHLADLMGVHENTVWNLERNPEGARVSTIGKAAYALGVTTAELFQEPQCTVGTQSEHRV